VDRVYVKPSFMKCRGWTLQLLTVPAVRAEKHIPRRLTFMLK